MANEVELQCIANEVIKMLAEKNLTVQEAMRIGEMVTVIAEYEAKLKPLKSG